MADEWWMMFNPFVAKKGKGYKAISFSYRTLTHYSRKFDKKDRIT
jgi:hypothetical protein